MHDTNLLENQLIAWTPTPDVIERSQLTKFMRQVGVETWDELYQFSVGDVEKFTEEVLKFLDIKFDPPYSKLLDISNGIEFPKWLRRSGATLVPTGDASSSEKTFGGEAADEDKSVLAPTAGLNITEMCLDRWQTDEMKDQPAVAYEAEDHSNWYKTYEELLIDVETLSTGLRSLGFGKGDAVAIHLPMIPETVIALLAIGRIGAIAVPVFSGYGVEAIASRMNAVGAKGLFTCESYERRGKAIHAFDTARAAVDLCPSVEKVVCVTGPWSDLKFSDGRFILWNDVKGFDWDNNVGATSAEDPLIILYTSGTTGKPKGIAHTHASFPIKAAQDMAFGTDVGRGTRICWYTDIGWMMGPWLIYGALINGATICIYDGAPDYPTPDRMWEFCAKHKVEVLGISPTLVRALARSGDTPVPTDAASASEKTFGGGTADEDKSVLAPPRKGWSRTGKLPHFDGEVAQFITFRLGDSLPKSALERLRQEIQHDKLSDDSEEYRKRVEEYLDEGAGECILRDPRAAGIVELTLLNEHGTSCDLKAWVIMPNHAHILLRMHPRHDLAGMMKRIKGVSARQINELLGRKGSLWQPDYFDRFIRDGNHFSKVLQYIENNPVISKVSENKETYRFSSAWIGRSGDTPVPIGGSSAESSFERRSDVREDRSVLAPHQRHDLSSLRIFASTGEPWNPAPWWWLFEKVGNSKLPIINYSGGTEIAGGILMGNPLLPIKPCSFPAPCPGMDVDILNENGEPVNAGEVGELVIKQPWIGMARGFWQEKERYLETYWSRFKNIWVHGDWAMRDAHGHWFILGRSDDTLKVAGKRVGPAEVESLLVAHPLVTEAAVIGVPDEAKGTAMVAFVVLSVPPAVAGGDFEPQRRGDAELKQAETRSVESVFSATNNLEQELKTLVAKDMGKPLAPSKIHFVSALPKTRNAKVMRRVLRAAYLGEDAGDLSALENPQALQEIEEARR